MDKDLLISDLKIDEGVRQFPYRDNVGKLSIGVGRNLDDVGLYANEIDLLVSNDIDRVISSLNHLMPWWQQMTEPRQRVLANMAFNMGMEKLRGFKNALAFMQEGKYNSAADEMLDSVWAKQVGNRANRLAQIMRDGA